MEFFNQALSTVKSKVDQYRGSEVERKVKQVTSTEQWHAPNSVKTEIAEATYDYQGFTEVMQLVWARLSQPPNMYVVIVKTLALLEHLIRVGSPRVIDNCRDHIYQIRSLEDFEYHDGERDRGAGVRETAKRIVELLNDEDALKRIREEFDVNREKYVAISNGGSVTNKYGGSGSGSSSKYSGMSSGGSKYEGYSGGSTGASSGSKYEGYGGGASNTTTTKSKYDGFSGDSFENDEYSNASSANNSMKVESFTETRPAAKKAAPAAAPSKAVVKPAAKHIPLPDADEFGDDAFTSAATVAPTRGGDFDFDADFDSAATAVPAPAPAAAKPAPAAASFDVFSSAPAADPFSAMASAPAPSAPAAQPFADPFGFSSAPAPAPAAAPAFDVFSFDAPAAAAPAPVQSKPTPSADVDFFGDFSSAPAPAAPAASQNSAAAKKVETKIKNDDIWGLADLDLTEEKKEEKKPTSTYASSVNMWNASSSADPFSNLVPSGNAPAPMMAPMQQRQQPMGYGMQGGMSMQGNFNMQQQGYGMPMQGGMQGNFNMQQGFGMPQQNTQNNNFW